MQEILHLQIFSENLLLYIEKLNIGLSDHCSPSRTKAFEIFLLKG